ncbi:MAG: hypothetical protein AAFU53_20620, partial [Cyanobacteria bacterium J06632_3]
MLNLVLFILAIAIALCLGYVVARGVLGTQAAQRNLIYAAPWLVIGALIPLLLTSIGRYGLIIFYALYVLCVLAWLVSWPWRKRTAGNLLLEVGATTQNKLLFWLGLGLVGLAIAMTIPLLDRLTGDLVTTGGIISGV